MTAQVVADFARPDAIMLPHYPCDLTPFLEDIAVHAAKYCGVILLSQDKAFSQCFIASQKYPEHFSIVTASMDTPWIRDRAPLTVKVNGEIQWYQSIVEDMDRPYDDKIFASISKKPLKKLKLKYLPQGNMVAGSKGLMFSTREILSRNQLQKTQLEKYAKTLGIQEWILFSGFRKEMTGHADLHIRVLKANLIAVAWNLSVKADRVLIQQLIDKIQSYNSHIRVIKIPIRSRNREYASLVNWLQIGHQLLIPRYDLTQEEDIEETNKLLNDKGFQTHYIYSPTLKMAGSIHCLTASIYI